MEIKALTESGKMINQYKSKMQSKNLISANLILTLIVLCFSTTIHAQDFENQFGVKGGIFFTNQMVDLPSNPDGQIGFNVAGVARIPFIQDLFFFQPELGYSRKGTSFNLEAENFSFDFDYIEAPLLISIGKPNVSFVEVGGYFSYLLNTNVSQPSMLNNESLPNISADDYNRLDYGIAFGLNFNYNNYFVGARYYYGLADIARTSIQDIYGIRARNRGFQVYLMYMF